MNSAALIKILTGKFNALDMPPLRLMFKNMLIYFKHTETVYTCLYMHWDSFDPSKCSSHANWKNAGGEMVDGL